MASEEDNFDIDIYGDGEGMDEDTKAFYKEENEKNLALKETKKEAQAVEATRSKSEQQSLDDKTTVVKDEVNVNSDPGTKPKAQQGVKRKGDSDERRIDVGATNALMLSDLHWWTTEDDIREWVNEVDAEDELRDITFSEHKVNGKSKGQAYLEFSSPQASTAVKRKVEMLAANNNASRKFTVVFTNASSNPFKTLPKDAPARGKDERPSRGGATSYSGSSHQNYNSNSNSFRGRGGFGGGRGGYNQGGYNNNNANRNFAGPMGGGFNNNPGFQGNMPMMNNFNNFANRGAMMANNMRGNMGGMRGGRGGMNNNNMTPMGMMGMNMGMNPMMGMGPQGFGGGGPQFTPGMFNQGGHQGMNGGDWGHGAKRQRQD